MEVILTCSTKQSAFHIGEPSEISAARRGGNEICRGLGFDEVRTGQVALIITEAGTNIVKHAGRGEILLRPVRQDDVCGIEIVALDAGPGMANVALQMEDGQSTVGTYGVGLGAIGRLSHEFDFYSLPGKGTVLSMTVWNHAKGAPRQDWDMGVVCIPLAGETECGDVWSVCQDRGDLNVVVADGLGHGPEAAAASLLAHEVLQANPHAAPTRLLQLSHDAMRGTRGAAMAALRVEPYAGVQRFAGVGNIAACVFEPAGRRHMLSHNGIVGSNLRKLQEFSSDWQAGSMLVLHSDGIGTRWDLEQYPGLAVRRASIIAAVLYRDFGRGNDDTTVLVLRELAGQ